MTDESKIVPFTELKDLNVDLNLAVEQANKMTAVLDSMGIEKATFKTGATFHRDNNSDVATLATDGLIVQKREHTTTVTIRHQGSTEKEAMKELNDPEQITQETLGSFSGKSQPWASISLSDTTKD